MIEPRSVHIVGVGLLVALAGCASPRMEVARFDGAPLDPAAREQANAECAAKAKVAQFNVQRQAGDEDGKERVNEMGQVREASFQGCMAEKGMKVTWEKQGLLTGSLW